MPSTTKRKIDAHALLTSQGWRGKGHSLHPTNDSTGLKHHILIKRDGNDGAGLGLKKDHKVEAWWMNAFDQALKGIDTTSGTMKRTAGGGNLDLDKIVSKGIYKYSGGNGLYNSFVKGGLLAGTVDKNLVSSTGLLTPPDSGGLNTGCYYGGRQRQRQERNQRGAPGQEGSQEGPEGGESQTARERSEESCESGQEGGEEEGQGNIKSWRDKRGTESKAKRQEGPEGGETAITCLGRLSQPPFTATRIIIIPTRTFGEETR
ncbi:hypothetical protein PG993_006009 [Apiospora rasikravindrae]|uniref:Uncharacterized protein n=1 Tax=Apiospora rasikravindrae TaxID=990691 RepID=A0ABR1TCS8_9PEZI